MMETIQTLSLKVQDFLEQLKILGSTVTDLAGTQRDMLSKIKQLEAQVQVLQEELLELKKASPKQP